MFRLLLTIVTAICLTGTYQVYAFVVGPILRPIARPEIRPPTASVAQVGQTQTADLARQHLPNSAWAQDAGYNWEQSENASLFFNEFQRLPDGGNKIRLAPFAMVWRDPKRADGARYTVEAAGAVVNFQNQFFDDAIDLRDTKPGRIVHMTLEGKVRINGPDNLQIEGEKFIFSEESAQLYSDWPVMFRFGPSAGQMNAVRGQADQVTIEFAPVSVSPYGPEMPHVGEVTRLRLRRAVRLDMTYDLNGEPAKTLVSSDGPFTYDVTKKLAQFEENVTIVRPTVKDGIKQTDSLKCHWLGLQFVDAPPGSRGLSIAQGGDSAPAIQQVSGTSKPGGSMLSSLAFRYLRALTNTNSKGADVAPVHVESTEHAFAGDMQDLRYDAVSHELTLLDEKEVHVRHEATQIFSPQIRVVHGERGAASGGRFEVIECAGPGHFEQLDDAREHLLFFGSWAERVHVAPDPESPGNILSIYGGASLVQPDRVQIDGETIQIWLDSSAASLPGTARPQGTNLRKLPVRRALAQGSVQMATAEAIVQSDRVDARFAEGRVPARNGAARSGRLGNENPRRMPGTGPAEPPFVIRAREIDATILRDPVTQEVDVPELTGLHNVRITREAPPTPAAQRGGRVNVSGAVEITGQRLHMQNPEGGGPRQILTLSGSVDPRQEPQQDAKLRVGDYRVESPVLVFNRGENRVDVPGPGQLHIPVATDVRGKKLEQPQIMDVAWIERMSFDGQTARFLQRVKARVGDSQLTCEAMEVGLNRRLDLQSDHPDTTGLDLKSIACRHQVTIETYEYADSRVVEVMKGRLAEFHLDNETGEFEGLGPGMMQDWRVAKSGESSRWLSVEPTSSVQTNQPTSEDKRHPWNYAQMIFKGKVTGNIHRQDATLTRNVQILYAPVAQALQVFDRNDLSFESGKDNGNNAAWLGCQELDLILVKGRDGESTAQLRAKGGDGEDASLEGRKFTANGHEVLYDQGKGQFILRGRGTDKADIHFQDQAGRRPTDVQAHIIEYVPSRRSLILDGATFNGQAP